ncbi:hypothetical protein C3F00_046020 [Pseudomonas sp. MWU13-2860]|nr:hypothetical protein C3F00_046020 [Pseudomonas sp. MWU13-2860]
MDMALHLETADGWAWASLSGELTVYTAAQLKSELLPLLEYEAVSRGFAGVTELDGCAVQLLLVFGRQARRVEWRADNPLLCEAFGLLGVTLTPPPGGVGGLG